MKYMILIIFSCYVILTHEIIAPRGIAENDNPKQFITNNSAIFTGSVYNMTQATILEKVNKSYSILKNSLEKDMLADPQPKDSEINERAFIYIKISKPANNKKYLTQTRDDEKDPHLLFEDLEQNSEQKDRVDPQARDEEHKNHGMLANNSKNSASKIGKQDENKGDHEKRDFLELLKTPLLRSVQIAPKNGADANQKKSQHKMNSKSICKQMERRKNRSKLQIKNQFNEEYMDNNASKEVDNLMEQFMNISFEKPNHDNGDSFNEADCNNEEAHNHAMCKCKPGSYHNEYINNN